ncbi:MAG: glycosyltransferase [Spirochaeta sp.]|nr:glycosyltransferase [Spirochaeta sp.]
MTSQHLGETGDTGGDGDPRPDTAQGSPRITVVTPHYPAPRFPERGAFVERLVRQWIAMEVPVSVIAPDALPVVLRSRGKPVHDVDPAGDAIVRPLFVSYGNAKHGVISRYRLTRSAFVRAAVRGGRTLGRSTGAPDLFYGKFLFRGGEGAFALGERYGVPAVADMGESYSFLDLERRTLEDAKETVRRLAGIVCVSSRLRDEAIALGADPARVIVAPNDVDADRFRVIDRAEARRQLGLPEDRFLVAFTGHFVERKGPLRVAAAIERINQRVNQRINQRVNQRVNRRVNRGVDQEAGPTGTLAVSGIFLGRGAQIPSGPGVLHAGSVPNDTMPLWLNAADIFVLPTLREGHCNAINEAVACGLPIVSSDIEDIRRQVDSAYSILVDPTDVDAIAAAIENLRDAPDRRGEMSAAALAAMHGPGVTRRADTILRFLQKTIKEWNGA